MQQEHHSAAIYLGERAIRQLETALRDDYQQAIEWTDKYRREGHELLVQNADEGEREMNRRQLEKMFYGGLLACRYADILGIDLLLEYGTRPDDSASTSGETPENATRN